MSDMNKGRGKIAPLDTGDYMEVLVTVEDGFISAATYECNEDEFVSDCASTVCRVITDKPFADVMQMNGNAVIYNTECDLPREKLYLASMAVMAAKSAVRDYAKKNSIDLPDGGCCNCG